MPVQDPHPPYGFPPAPPIQYMQYGLIDGHHIGQRLTELEECIHKLIDNCCELTKIVIEQGKTIKQLDATINPRTCKKD